jgi:hypothetical protein
MRARPRHKALSLGLNVLDIKDSVVRIGRKLVLRGVAD